jgi:hypothetical protein
VPCVSHGGVPTAGTVLVVVLLVDRVCGHVQDRTRSHPTDQASASETHSHRRRCNPLSAGCARDRLTTA